MRLPVSMLVTLGLLVLLAPLSIAAAETSGPAPTIAVGLTPEAKNPPAPQMGDWLRFHTVIRNDGSAAVEGIIGWISLVRIDKGKEQPIDLEDWSAHKAVTVGRLEPGKTIETEWPMRLIQAGRYRVVVSVVTRSGGGLTASPFADFTVRQKPVVQSQRVIPIALGVPLLIAGLWFWQRRRARGAVNGSRNRP